MGVYVRRTLTSCARRGGDRGNWVIVKKEKLFMKLSKKKLTTIRKKNDERLNLWNPLRGFLCR